MSFPFFPGILGNNDIDISHPSSPGVRSEIRGQAKMLVKYEYRIVTYTPGA